MSLSSSVKIVLQSVIRTAHINTSVRLYARWTHRKPAKVLLPAPTSLKTEKIIDLDPAKLLKPVEKNASPLEVLSSKNAIQSKSISSEQIKEIKNKRETKITKLKQALSQNKVFGENNEIIYEKCKDNDGRISSLLVKMKSKKERLKTGMVLVEGWRMIVDGLLAHCQLKYLVFSCKEDLNNLRIFLPRTGVKIYKIPYKEINLWSDVDTSPGIFGVFETPKMESIKRPKPFPLHIICDNIRVPGNLGAILRAAAGMGCDNVLLTKGCVDLWDAKVLRSAAGAHFRLPVHFGLGWDNIEKLVPKDSSVFIADSNVENNDTKSTNEIISDHENVDMPVIPYYSVDYTALKSITLIVGGETEGISEDSYRFAANRQGLRLNIPLQRGVDSLNTGMATAVIAFEIKKQLLQAWTKAKVEKERQILQGI